MGPVLELPAGRGVAEGAVEQLLGVVAWGTEDGEGLEGIVDEALDVAGADGPAPDYGHRHSHLADAGAGFEDEGRLFRIRAEGEEWNGRQGLGSGTGPGCQWRAHVVAGRRWSPHAHARHALPVRRSGAAGAAANGTAVSSAAPTWWWSRSARWSWWSGAVLLVLRKMDTSREKLSGSREPTEIELAHDLVAACAEAPVQAVDLPAKTQPLLGAGSNAELAGDLQQVVGQLPELAVLYQGQLRLHRRAHRRVDRHPRCSDSPTLTTLAVSGCDVVALRSRLHQGSDSGSEGENGARLVARTTPVSPEAGKGDDDQADHDSDDDDNDGESDDDGHFGKRDVTGVGLRRSVGVAGQVTVPSGAAT